MKIEKHNSHGLHLSVTVTPMEALALARRLVDTATKALESRVNHYTNEPCLFEDDNGRFEPTDFTVTVETGSMDDVRPTYPCGRQTAKGDICNKHEGHEPPCYRW